MTKKKRVGVLISGRGSNLQALINACKKRDYPAEIVLVISNVPQAQGLLRAEAALIPTLTIDHKDFPTREDFDAALDAALTDSQASSSSATRASCGCTPRASLSAGATAISTFTPRCCLPSEGSIRHERVIAAGCKISGCTIHFVRAEMDEGPIVAQAAVPVLASDTAETLATRVLEAEHHLYPHALALVASGAVFVKGERVFDSNEQAQVPLFSPPLA